MYYVDRCIDHHIKSIDRNVLSIFKQRYCCIRINLFDGVLIREICLDFGVIQCNTDCGCTVINTTTYLTGIIRAPYATNAYYCKEKEQKNLDGKCDLTYLPR